MIHLPPLRCAYSAGWEISGIFSNFDDTPFGVMVALIGPSSGAGVTASLRSCAVCIQCSLDDVHTYRTSRAPREAAACGRNDEAL